MAFWNRKKRKKQAEEYAKLEAEAREYFEELRAKRLQQAKEEKEKQDAETQTAKEESEQKDLYETEIRLPVMKNDRERYVAECCSSIREVDRQIEGIREEYAKVTDGLMDIQKIDRFAGEDKNTCSARVFNGVLAFSCNKFIIFLSISSILKPPW